MKMTSKILAVADAYCAATGRSRARVSTLVFNRGAKLDDIAGGADLNTGSYERAMMWFAEHWPADGAWPDYVVRPAVSSSQKLPRTSPRKSAEVTP